MITEVDDDGGDVARRSTPSQEDIARFTVDSEDGRGCRAVPGLALRGSGPARVPDAAASWSCLTCCGPSGCRPVRDGPSLFISVAFKLLISCYRGGRCSSGRARARAAPCSARCSWCWCVSSSFLLPFYGA
ncbi:hypothetical protein AAFF_G00216540 [Aldrovandia affinis]|uniref:Uncharacterized protein n=1 Tax=Aldrovandia affinis TaxID=143900 RepID=A0AAD7VVT6_9TELE|nr:hypothetical protein AAFF_G00216540 [Aldrovandia affinis]